MPKEREKLRVGDRDVQVSSLDKVLFPEDGITKGELVEYYRRVAETMIPHIRDRPLSMRRFPDGIQAGGFFQQKASDYFPEWMDRIEVEKQDGKIVHVLCNSPAALVYLANQNMITPHVWLSRADSVHQPDQVIVDLDPTGDDFGQVRDAARVVRKAFEERGLTAFVMTTGSKGVHVRAPIKRGPDFDEVREYARDLAEDLAGQYPDELTTEQRKNKRKGRIYLDVLRIAYAQTAVPPYAVRGRPGAPIATPIGWHELGRVNSSTYHIRNIFRRLSRMRDPWNNMASHAQALQVHA